MDYLESLKNNISSYSKFINDKSILYIGGADIFDLPKIYIQTFNLFLKNYFNNNVKEIEIKYSNINKNNLDILKKLEFNRLVVKYDYISNIVHDMKVKKLLSNWNYDFTIIYDIPINYITALQKIKHKIKYLNLKHISLDPYVSKDSILWNNFEENTINFIKKLNYKQYYKKYFYINESYISPMIYYKTINYPYIGIGPGACSYLPTENEIYINSKEFKNWKIDKKELNYNAKYNIMISNLLNYYGKIPLKQIYQLKLIISHPKFKYPEILKNNYWQSKIKK